MSILTLVLSISVALNGFGAAVQPVPDQGIPTKEAEKKAPPSDANKDADKKERVSEADQIVRLQRHLDEDLKNLSATKKELADPDNEYHRAEVYYRGMEKTLEEKQTDLKTLKAKKLDTVKVEGEIAALEKRRKLARDRFNVAIKEHKILQDREALLTVKVTKIRQAIELLQGTPPPAAKKTPDNTPQPAPSAPEKKTDTAVPSPSAPGAKSGAALGNVEELKAQKQAADKEAAAAKAKEVLKSIDDHLLFLKKNLDLDKRLDEMLQEKASNIAAIHANLAKDLDKQRAAQASDAILARLNAKLTEMEKLAASITKDLRENETHRKELEGHLTKLQADRAQAEEDVERKSTEAQEAENHLQYLRSPWALHNVITWMWGHIPTVAIVILVMVLFQWLVRVASRRIVVWMTHYHFRGSMEDRENRADTLVGVFRNAASFVIFVTGMLMILQGVGIPIIPLLGGAAAGGLAVAFGAQNLIKDYLSGFMLLMEDQYGVNDVVKIAGIAGQVESITLRVTSLRDSEGTVHFVPHSTITTVSNMTHRWARAFFEIHVAYKEDVDRVMQVLTDLCKEMRADPEFGSSILDDPEMWGVDQLTEHGVNIQFVLRTAALKQWCVKRELLRRIKNKFDELAILMPHFDFVP